MIAQVRPSPIIARSVQLAVDTAIVLDDDFGRLIIPAGECHECEKHNDSGQQSEEEIPECVVHDSTLPD